MNQNEELIYYSLHHTDTFNDEVKYYIKSKKFTKFPKDIENIKDDLKKGIFNGTIIGNLDLDENRVAYKIRAKNSNTGVGKSNGYRLIYLVEDNNKIIFLVTIYYKKDDNKIPNDSEIKQLIKKYCI